jgi:O-antigen/teichoic acid export membrane protein
MKTLEPVSEVLRTDHLHADLKGRSVRGGLATISSQGARFLIQSLSTVVLARLLTPRDFGIVAMVMAITALATAFADLGLSEATIQCENITLQQVSALFWINVAIGLTFMLATMALAPVMAWFYREPRLAGITLVSSTTFLIGGLRVQHEALLKRQMRFGAVAGRDVASVAVGVCVAIVMAWRGAGYWAIVALPVASQFTRMALSWLAVRWIPNLPRRGAHVRSLVTFGGNVAVSYLLVSATRNADNVLIGWWWGATPLGFYSRAFNLLMMPLQQLSGPVNSVLVPAFSRIQHDAERFARYYLRVANLTMWAIAPIFAVLFVAAQPVIALVLGRQWSAAAPVFRLLVIAALGQPLFQLTNWSFVSRGHSGELLRILAITSPLVVGSFIIGLPYGINGVALAGSLMQVAILPWILTRAFRGTNLTLSRVGQAIVCPILLSVGGVFAATATLRFVHPKSNISELLLVIAAFVVTCSISALAPAVREEIASLWEIFEGSALRHWGFRAFSSGRRAKLTQVGDSPPKAQGTPVAMPSERA